MSFSESSSSFNVIFFLRGNHKTKCWMPNVVYQTRSHVSCIIKFSRPRHPVNIHSQRIYTTNPSHTTLTPESFTIQLSIRLLPYIAYIGPTLAYPVKVDVTTTSPLRIDNRIPNKELLTNHKPSIYAPKLQDCRPAYGLG